ncbi:aldo keto reductase isoform B [Micractinium conductrix]|uniref:Aldo keto reductase isoform A n=1 Tax=Micractinium conductrix TaxID=554055 RepID=A0A2P6VP63_9CHLO|nr:aldo keto reductase isoform A [Micractinium conductrix]PSC75889.1 aldo keto reductase isoform B [Micractinium conductrix]|eukprot:PSC75888.1 aldo keto reductase isoform A [Micractinium conductrix]
METGEPAAAAPGPARKPSAIPRAELAPALGISRVVKGCWQLSGGHTGDRASDRTSGQAAVDDFQPFVDAGITTFDTADIYGPSESLIGRYLASHQAEKANVQVLTKFCCFGDSMRQAKDPRHVEQCIDASRQRLGLESLDLVQFYWHDYSNKNYVAAAQNLAALQKKGKIKHVGATNFDVPRLQEFVDAGVTIANNQVQYSLLDRRPEVGPMAAFCEKNDVKLLPYGVLAGGLLTDKYLGAKPSDIKIDTYSKSKYASVIGQAGGWEWFQSLLQALSGVAQKHGVTIADVASRWVLDRPQVAGVIIGARNAAHVADHEKIFSFQLDQADLDSITKVLEQGAKPTGDCYTWERGGKW